MNMIAMLVGLLLTLFACAPVWATLGGGTNVHNHSSAASGGGTLNLSGTLSSTKACATGYTRLTPNYCIADSYDLVTSVQTTCTTITAPTGSKAILLQIHSYIGSNNAIGQRWVNVGLYSDSGCTSPINPHFTNFFAYEFTPIAGNLVIAAEENTTIVRVNTSWIVYAKIVTRDSSASNAYVGIAGYFD